ncbi:interleukin-13 receptor subunit alpha-1-like [Leuresthes tenuis]|uniref:interleukin-13 receptor subunit alpha-1-like n=1 Tax=Leuresthes tenuis TaxID=355514 RepID=UPI003B50C18A
MSSRRLVFGVMASNKHCIGWTDSDRAIIDVSTRKQHVELVKNFKCVLEATKMNCSWIPVNKSQNLSFFYRHCGKAESNTKSVEFNQPYRGENWEVFTLKPKWRYQDICVVVQTEDKMHTFKPKFAISTPQMEVKEDGDYLTLTWASPDVGGNCSWEYDVSYTHCSKKNQLTAQGPMKILYDKCCEYEIHYSVKTDKYCPQVPGDNSKSQVYGAKRLCLETAAVVCAVVIPIVLFVCVILSCYCFRRHKHIICPVMPDPSDFLKEMMNGNKENKTPAVNLYKPVPERFDSEKIVLVPKTSPTAKEPTSPVCL